MFPQQRVLGTGDHHQVAGPPVSVRPSRRFGIGGRRARTATLFVAAATSTALLASLVAPASARVLPVEPERAVSTDLGARLPTPAGGNDRACKVSKILVPRCGPWWGAFSLNEGAETPTDAIRSLEAGADDRVDIVHYYFRDLQIWPPAWMIDLAREPGNKRLLAINWKPEAYHTWAETAAGAADSYIDQEAAYLSANFREPFFLTIHHEPEDEVNQTPGSGYTATDYSNMYRHVADRLRAQGVHNAIYVMNYMGFQGWGLQPWFPDLYPGDSYVDWIAFDPYASSSLGDQDRGFRFLLNSRWGETSWTGAYRYFSQIFPGKPIMLGEWGVGEKPGDPAWKARFFHRVGQRIAGGDFPNLKALLYFDSRYGAASGDTRVDTSTTSLESMRRLLNRKDVWAPSP